jgi:DNA processing protein
MTDACDACLRRSHLIAFLAADVQRLLPVAGPARAEVLDAAAETLVAALPKPRQGEARAMLRAFKPGRARADAQTAGIDLVCPHAEPYPAPLRDLRQPPPVLYATRLSEVPDPHTPAAAVIGSRRPSEYGRGVAYSLARGLGSAGVPVVSGLALGIDAVAHRGCLDAAGRTIAVLASGVDVAYPRTNRGLYERIRESGSIVSEMPPGSRPYRWLFPARTPEGDLAAHSVSGRFNIGTLPGQGIVIHDAGLARIDEQGLVAVLHGIHDVFDEGEGAFCEALS